MRASYPSDLTDCQWLVLEKFLSRWNMWPRRRNEMRDMMNAIFYWLKTGCQWRQLPIHFPPWKSVYGQVWRWKHNGRWEELHRLLREQVREQEGREAQPSAGIIDSQSVKTAQKGGFEVTMLERKPKGANAIS